MPEGNTRPNILFFYPDTLRWDWIETRGRVPVRTPNLKRLAEEGVDFTCAVTPSPLCAPARACLAAGMEYERCRVPDNRVNYPLDQMTFYTLLRESGYHVMGCGKFDLHKPDLDWGLDGKRLIHEWGFSDGIDNEGKMDGINSYRRNNGPTGPYMHFLHQRGLAEVHVADLSGRNRTASYPTPLPDDAYCDNWLQQNGLDLIRRAPAGKPWFLQVNCTGPHGPWDITASMKERWSGIAHPQPFHSTENTPQEHDGVRQNFSAMVENIDRWLGVHIDLLRERSELDNTLIVFSSDHGDMLGDHDEWGKSKPRHGSVGVPLVVWGPGVRRGAVCDEPTTNLDLAATFLDYAGVQPPSDWDARSLRPLLEGRTRRHREWVRSALGDWSLIFDGRHKLIRYDDGRQMLYDLKEDPGEHHNLAEAASEIVERLAQADVARDSGR